MLLLPEGRKDEDNKTIEKKFSFGNPKTADRKIHLVLDRVN